MDFELCLVKTEPQEAEEYPPQYYKEENQTFNLIKHENMTKIDPEQSDNIGLYLSNPMPSPNSKQCDKCGFIYNAMNEITEHINNCHQATTALGNVTNYNLSSDGEVIKTEIEILDLNLYQVLYDEENNTQLQPNQIMHQCNEPNEIKEHSSSDKNTLKPTNVRKSKHYLCISCKKSFTTSTHLKTHYKTISHKNAVERNDLPDSSTLPINSKHNPLEDVNKYSTTITPTDSVPTESAVYGIRSSSDNNNLIVGKTTPISLKLKRNKYLFKERLGHEANHGEEKPHKCDQCEKQFKFKSFLKQHMYVHIEKKPLSCDLCEKRFLTKALFNLHKAVHTAEKPYKCNECSQYFNHKSNLNRHMYLQHF